MPACNQYLQSQGRFRLAPRPILQMNRVANHLEDDDADYVRYLITARSVVTKIIMLIFILLTTAATLSILQSQMNILNWMKVQALTSSNLI